VVITLPNRRKIVVFNIGGGAFRLIAAIHYNRGIVYIRKFLTHAEYSKEEWKNDEYENRSGKPDKTSAPLEILNFLVEENEISTRELGKILGIDHSVAARILKGERAITVEHAKSLGARFKLDPKAFLELG
jgi:antitoxin component HigA of HigAB toxin-antitoxin module